MNPQLGLPFNAIPVSRRTDPTTSQAAADQAIKFAAGHEGRILAALTHPMTKDEIADSTKLDPTAVARRLGNMEDRRMVSREALGVNASGRTVYRTRDNAKGNACALWHKLEAKG